MREWARLNVSASTKYLRMIPTESSESYDRLCMYAHSVSKFFELESVQRRAFLFIKDTQGNNYRINSSNLVGTSIMDNTYRFRMAGFFTLPNSLRSYQYCLHWFSCRATLQRQIDLLTSQNSQLTQEKAQLESDLSNLEGRQAKLKSMFDKMTGVSFLLWRFSIWLWILQFGEYVSFLVGVFKSINHWLPFSQRKRSA